TFVEARYGYDYRNLNKINRAIEFMTREAVELEQAKINGLNLPRRIYNGQWVYKLDFTTDNWTVEPLGQGRFRITVSGKALINDAMTHTDINNPFPKPFDAMIEVAT